MCGIAGYIGTREIDKPIVDACLERMRHRGPDDQSAYSHVQPNGRRVYLLHSRLSIIDLAERSNQPFRAGSRLLTYNGELYNYLELRQKLAQRGCEFETASDTEVLLKALITHGWPVLDRGEGMWAFALYDEADGLLTLSRDRFGEKPLYLYRDATGLYFGSEIKFIFTLLGRPLPINYRHLYRYMVNGYKALYKVCETFFEGIEELPAASVLLIDGEGVEVSHRYWHPTFAQDEAMGYEAAVEGARERLIRAVELRLRADVPLAFCMSGGVDSNTLISIARRVFDYDVHGFTIVNTDSRYEEQEFVNKSVQALRIRHTSIPTSTQDFLPRLRGLVRHHDSPVITISYYAHWLLMEAIASHGYRISISGTAADELFSGYYDHHNFYLAEARRADPVLYQTALTNWQRDIAPIVRNRYLQNPDVFVETPGLRDHIYLNSKEFAASLRHPWEEPFVECEYTDDLLRNRMLNELFQEFVPCALHEDDLNAMYYSIENRSPYLDRSLFDFCNRIPTRHLIQDGVAKAVLRDAVQGIVPEEVRTNRRKVGFNAPIESFLSLDEKVTQDFLLEDSPIFEHVRREYVEDLIGKGDLPNSESKFLFYFLNSKLFIEEFGTT